MRFVLDSCVSLKWVLPEADSLKAMQLRDEVRKSVHEILAPQVFELEIAHALTRAERTSRIPVGQALVLWADIMCTPPDLQASIALTPRAIGISSDLRVGVYDCLYVALADREQCDLVTSDDLMIKRLQPKFPFIRSLASMP
jgi:predicted nucleic acid-binding protein